MATQEEKIAKIQRILKSEYDNTRWKGFLSELFSSSNFFTNPSILPGINASIASQALHIGSISINENGIARNIAVYEVMLADNVVLERNRVGLRNLLKTHWSNQDAAFIVYYHPQNKSWRFSYVSELKTFNEAGEYVDNKTEPKRYTYVLGETESCRTAAIQFSKLQDKASNATLDDVKEAFSVEKMSKEFFDTYKEHYLDFVQFLTGKRLEKVSGKWEEVFKHAPNKQLISIFNNNEKDVRDFCKKLLGRIVFLYFIQKKGWLGVPVTDDWGKGNYNYLSELFKNCRNPAIFYSEYLSKLFFDTLNQQRPNDVIEIISGEPCRIPYLNGGLFEEDDQNHRNLVLEANLFKRLFEFFDQYNFTIYEDDPNDHTVAVDPEMLGHIFENLLEDNKDKGAFYTPKEIVHYMCQESLIEYLTTWFEGKNYQVQQDTFISLDNAQQTSFVSANEGRTGQGVLEIAQPAQSNNKVINRSLIEKLLKKQLSDEDKQAVIEHAAEFNEALDKVKICDPAIGSGAFPMGLLQEIFTAKQTIHSFTYQDLANFEPAKVKLNIIQNSIYGVDIERGAVDIARLRFWLSLVVDEPEPQPLPNLDYKIVVGNSLISKLGDDVIEIDWDVKKQVTFDMFGAEETGKIKQTLTELNQLQKAFFNPNSDKKNLAPKIRNLKIDLLIQQLNLMVETRGLKTAPRKLATLSQKDFVAQTELHLQTQGWLAQIRQLQALKTQSEKPLDFFNWELNFPEVMNKEVTAVVGFDILIGNPPYVSTKGTTEQMKSELQSAFGFSDDLYNHFIIKATELLKVRGVNTMITPDTYFTTLTKKELRKSLLSNKVKSIVHLGHDIFDSAMVSTAIFLVQKDSARTDNKVLVIDVKGKKEIKSGKSYEVLQDSYNHSINGSIFIPNETNLKIHHKLSSAHKVLVDKYWEKIATSKEIEKNKTELEIYRDSLKPGDWTLIGLVTEGGQGLATANNGKFVGIKYGTKEAIRVAQTRVTKLKEINNKLKTNYVMPSSEDEVWQLFDLIKEKHGRDIFGQGYLFRIVSQDDIVDLTTISDDEKENGFVSSKRTFVPYDKGDKDGNRWYLTTPYFIDWSRPNVKFLKENSGKKGEGMPVVRNAKFYFKEGFCYSDIKTFYLRCRKKGISVHDVKSMSFFSLVDKLPEYYLITLINSKTIAEITAGFITNTPSFQINDCRALPIPVPNDQELEQCKHLFNQSVKIQEDFFSNQITVETRDELLNIVQIKIDEFVLGLFNI